MPLPSIMENFGLRCQEYRAMFLHHSPCPVQAARAGRNVISPSPNLRRRWVASSPLSNSHACAPAQTGLPSQRREHAPDAGQIGMKVSVCTRVVQILFASRGNILNPQPPVRRSSHNGGYKTSVPASRGSLRHEHPVRYNTGCPTPETNGSVARIAWWLYNSRAIYKNMQNSLPMGCQHVNPETTHQLPSLQKTNFPYKLPFTRRATSQPANTLCRPPSSAAGWLPRLPRSFRLPR
jgi:hypothetical protein